jgi:hypothetical protein
MPSLEVEAVGSLQTVVNSTVNARTLESILNNPLTFEKAPVTSTSGMNGIYTPLNKPFTLGHGKSNGISNSEKSPISSDKVSEGTNGVNGRAKIEEGKSVQNEISTEWPKTLFRPPGLKNVANTCYMNSTLQALMHVPPLVHHFLNKTHTERCPQGVRLCAFCRLERHARDSYPSSIGSRQTYLDPTGIIGKGGGNLYLEYTDDSAWR